MEIQLPELLPTAKRAVVGQLVTELAEAPGMVAIVLGGSYARGTAHTESDVDLGLYYRPESPFRIEEIACIAQAVAKHSPTVTGFYEWGAWVNGGAWIPTATGKVDFLYRNLDQVERTIDEAEQGIVHHDYPQQPPYGFYSIIYLAETSVCIPLFDPQYVIRRLKTRVATFPDALHDHVVNSGLWSVEFTLLHARSFAAKGDVYNTAGCFTRAATALTQVLYALNRCYFMSDKGAMREIDAFAIKPAGFSETLRAILGAPGNDAATLTASAAALESLWTRTVELTGGAYRPSFVMP